VFPFFQVYLPLVIIPELRYVAASSRKTTDVGQREGLGLCLWAALSPVRCREAVCARSSFSECAMSGFEAASSPFAALANQDKLRETQISSSACNGLTCLYVVLQVPLP
jgi:hypothetical protein